MTQIVFRLPCYRNFVQHLGEADAVVECIELASRDLKDRAEKSLEVVTTLSKTHNVLVNDTDWSTFLNGVAKLHVVSVYQQLEHFYKKLKNEHPNGNDWRPRGDESRLMHLIDCLGIEEQTLGKHRVWIVEYYRLTRNQYLHSLPEKETQTKFRTDLIETRSKWGSEYPLEAPHELDLLTFDDFILFTRAAKDLAFEICRTIDPTIENVVKTIKRLDGDGTSNVSIDRLSRYQNSERNLMRKIKRMVQSALGLPDSAVNYFVGNSPNGLLAQLVERQAP